MEDRADTEDQLGVGGIRLSLQGSDEDVHQTQPQRKEGNGLVMGPPVLFVELALQQNLKNDTGSLCLGYMKNNNLS